MCLDSSPESGFRRRRRFFVPDDLRTAIAREPAAQAWFNQLSYTNRKEWVRWVEEAKREETRRSRIEKTVASLAVGQRTH